MRRTILIRSTDGRRIPSARELKTAGFAVSAAMATDEPCEEVSDETKQEGRPDEDHEGRPEGSLHSEEKKKPVDRTGAEDGPDN